MRGAVLGGSLYFAADDGLHGPELWKTDGSEPGTVRVSDLPGSRESGEVDATGSSIYFVSTSQDDQTAGLYKSDGTAAGTGLLMQIPAGSNNLTAAGDRLFFSGDGQLWQSDGTPAGTAPVDGAPTTGYLMQLTFFDGVLYFHNYGDFRPSLWRSDGTEAGTFKLALSNNADIVPVAGKIYFGGYDSQHGSQLWVTDGTLAGTHLIKDVGAFPNYNGPNSITAIGSTVYYEPGPPIWQTDGTAAGTVRFTTQVVDYAQLVTAGPFVFFIGPGPSTVELWRLDGSAGGTIPLTSGVQSGPRDSIGDRMFFYASDGLHDAEPWVSDGTPGGTFMLADIRLAPISDDSDPFNFTSVAIAYSLRPTITITATSCGR